jgi:hypothetical protein
VGFPGSEILVGSRPMPRTAEDVENYLLQLDRHFEKDGATLVVPTAGAPIAILVTPPIVALRVDIGSVPRDEARLAPFYRKLLEYNATDLMHVSYGLDTSRHSPLPTGQVGGHPQTPAGSRHTPERVVLSGALELENLDVNELEAALSDIDLALARHVPVLHDLAGRDDKKSHAPR